MKQIWAFIVFFFSVVVNAQDIKTSQIEFDKAYLQAAGSIKEVSQGGFYEPQFNVGVKGIFSKSLDMKLSVGTASLLSKPNWISSGSEKISLVDAVATYRTNYIDFYAGQFLIPWGLEGTTSEADLFFQRTLLYENGYFILRDYGFGMRAQNSGFSFDLSAHSGEGGGSYNSDNKLFVTGQWSYQTPMQTSIGLSLTQGHYDNTQLRGANLFFKFNFANIKLMIEASGFQSIFNSVQTDWLAWHGDIIYHASDEINLLARYEQYNPNFQEVQNVLGRGNLSLEWHNRDSSSRLFFSFLKNNESLNESPNDEYRITWRIATL
ncbi:MAG: hypothetical protein IPM57_06760 [Oligoflexia bacterium]|nr:hypothetical protein [Oligoflexia bacterium]